VTTPKRDEYDNYQFMPFEEASAPTKGGYFEHFVDYWWLIHPEKGLVFWNPWVQRHGQRVRERHGLGWPQCNTFRKSTDPVLPGCTLRQIHSVFVQVYLSDLV